jgi:hypothetical protein
VETGQKLIRRHALLISLPRLGTELTAARGFETRTTETVGEALSKCGASICVEHDLVAPAARPAARELDSAALAGFRERHHGTTATHATSVND